MPETTTKTEETVPEHDVRTTETTTETKPETTVETTTKDTPDE